MRDLFAQEQHQRASLRLDAGQFVVAVLAVRGRIQATVVSLDVEIIQYSLRRNPAFTARPDPSRANSVYELVANACSLADPHTDFGSSTCSCFESMWRNL